MTPEELDQIAETERESQSQFSQRVNVCVAAGCLACQSQAVKDGLDQEVQRRGTKEHCQVKGVGWAVGLCRAECGGRPTSQNRDMGHPVLGWVSDVGHPQPRLNPKT